MWIVRLALRLPYTFVVLALLIAVLGVVSILSMPIDIFPEINIPVVNVIWSYSGLSPTEMQDRIVTVSERAFTTTVQGLEHLESVSLRGIAVTRLYFQPNVPIAGAIAQVNAQANQIVRQLPPGIFPPLIIQYNAASVPVVLASLSSDVLAEQQLNDLGNNFIRPQLATVPDAAIPAPYGGHSVLLPILSSGTASTLSVVSGARALMPKILAGLPSSLKVDFLFDQSLFVRAAITGVVREGAIAAGLTAVMILLFLGSWRSTLIVVTSIPLSILTSIIMLKILHQSLHVVTLGGTARAGGLLVDDATVEIENNHRQMELGKPLRRAILDGAAEVATPAFVATLSICIVFVPILFLGGVGGALFAPLAMSVVFAMLASYLLSRTLVPTMVLYLLAPEARARDSRDAAHGTPIRRSLFGRISDSFEAGFIKFTRAYEGMLDWALEHKWA